MDHYGYQEAVTVKPEDQLEISAEDLEKEADPRVIDAHDPKCTENVVVFAMNQKKHARQDSFDHVCFHYQQEGSIFMKGSQDDQDEQSVRAKRFQNQIARDAYDSEPMPEIDVCPGEEAIAVATRNQFNFSEFNFQTQNAIIRTRTVSTAPPVTTRWEAINAPWIIDDAYTRAFEDFQQAKSAGEDGGNAGGDSGPKKKQGDSDFLYSQEMMEKIKIMERMVNYNKEANVYHDYRYWEDASDQYRDGEGSLLPLFRFHCEKAKFKDVTCMKYHPKYLDLVAVSFGSYEFTKQGGGGIACYSFKNSSSPEYWFAPDSGVYCLDWHPSRTELLAAGCYDGTVMVFNVCIKSKKPVYIANVRTGKHTDPVWEVKWNPDTTEAPLSFYSVSNDGLVKCWSVNCTTHALEPSTLFELKMIADSDCEQPLHGLAGGICMDFHPNQSLPFFLVGTEEGLIHKCSKAYNSQYIQTYEGHSQAVYAVRWNPFHDDIFISCSADWTVKLWDANAPKPLMSFDLKQSVNDVAWAPYSATVFAAVDSDGKVVVYDLAVNRNEALCQQKVVKKTKANHVVFSQQDHAVLVGDARGAVLSLKLSPNLRKIPNIIEEGETEQEVQLRRFNDVLAHVDATAY